MVTVVYYIIGEPKQSKSFETKSEAIKFMEYLYGLPECQNYGILN